MPAHGEVTPSEREMLAALAPLWEGGPETIAGLRHYGAAITGTRAADYAEDVGRPVKYRFERDLRRLLRKGVGALWIDEPPILGGFGFTLHGRRFNDDTLRAYRVISLLEDAALLGEFRGASPRRTVWEIGGGWGGFAYHFKSLCPNVTYLMTGRPELFLLSAVYLLTLFPAARFRFYDPDDPGAFWKDWHNVDFAFAPEYVVPTLQPPEPALTVDLMSLERMTAGRICLHVQRAYDLGSRYFASVCPSRRPDAGIAAGVQPALDRFYWLHPICAPESLARRLSLSSTEGAVDRTYFLGWRRLRV